RERHADAVIVLAHANQDARGDGFRDSFSDHLLEERDSLRAECRRIAARAAAVAQGEGHHPVDLLAPRAGAERGAGADRLPGNEHPAIARPFRPAYLLDQVGDVGAAFLRPAAFAALVALREHHFPPLLGEHPDHRWRAMVPAPLPARRLAVTPQDDAGRLRRTAFGN